MDHTSLNQLSDIKFLLIIIVGILIFNSICFSLILKAIAKRVKTQAEYNNKNTFLMEAQRIENVGDYDSLLTLAEQRQKSFPYDLDAIWYVAIAHYKNKNWSAALSAFKELQRLDPVWRKYTVEEYIEEIQSNFTGPMNTKNK